MTKSLLIFTAVIFISCNKDPEMLSSKPGTNPKISESIGKGAIRNTPAQGDGNSGVSTQTGYTELQKRTYNVYDDFGRITVVWDGTYIAGFYNITLIVSSLSYPINAKLGDPVYGSVAVASNSTGEASMMSNYMGAGTYTGGTIFSINVIFMSLNGNFVSDLSKYNKALANYSSGTSALPQPPVAVSGGGFKYVSGKIIKIPTGTGFALAEVGYKPPVPSCNAICQFCKLHPNDPSCP